MNRIDFSKIEDPGSPEPVPAGTHPVEIAVVQYGSTRSGDDMLKLKLRITSSEHEGRTLHDNIVINDVGLQRAKHLCRAVGLDADSEIELSRETFLGRRALVRVEVEEFEDKDGNTRQRNRIPFIAWAPLADDAAVPF